MDWCERGFLTIDGVQLEYGCMGPPPSDAPTAILLHEGLGCVDLWRDFPEQLSKTLGCGVFLYSRQGYGASDPVQLPRTLELYDAWKQSTFYQRSLNTCHQAAISTDRAQRRGNNRCDLCR